jgi:hypothetical protein
MSDVFIVLFILTVKCNDITSNIRRSLPSEFIPAHHCSIIHYHSTVDKDKTARNPHKRPPLLTSLHEGAYGLECNEFGQGKVVPVLN